MLAEEKVDHFAAFLFSLGSGCFVQDTARPYNGSCDGCDLCSAEHARSMTSAQITRPHWRDSRGWCVFVDLLWLVFLETLKIYGIIIEDAISVHKSKNSELRP